MPARPRRWYRARYRHGYEPGCSIGVFTVQLAVRCDRLLATDVARAPLRAARDRLAPLTHVEVAYRAVPQDWPPGSFDLVVISELGYYHDAVAGMVSVGSWSEHPPTTAERVQRLHRHIVGHPHVHGANLRVSARAYLAVDGFPALPAHEDVALITALERTGHRILHTADAAVITSGRRYARAAAASPTSSSRSPNPTPTRSVERECFDWDSG
ncbi:MAG: hypothetical protein ACRDQU_04950 [Pseudonocardiaceae bacterium]